MMKDADYKPRRCRHCGWIGRPLATPKADDRKKNILSCACCGNVLGVYPRRSKGEKKQHEEVFRNRT